MTICAVSVTIASSSAAAVPPAPFRGAAPGRDRRPRRDCSRGRGAGAAARRPGGERAGARRRSAATMPGSTTREPLPMRIHNLYTDASGQSHFRDIEVEWVEETRAGKLSKRLPATGIIFREVPPTYDLDWHPAPRRQYIINLDAGVQITASDGESRVIGAGEVILVEDVHGKGHLSKAVDGKIRNCIFVPVDNGGCHEAGLFRRLQTWLG